MMKQQSPKKQETIKSLRSYHATVAVLSALGTLAVLFLDNWSEIIVWLPIAVAVFFDGKYEKADELAKQNLGKANTLTMWILFTVFAVIGMFARNSAIPSAVFIVIIFAALAIRSICFLLMDTPFGNKEGTDA
ncbi:MAG: hypothetical protein J6Z40_07195 [Oscillospiraceae bacterium]|jgi:hypothetical protein|nr:hypothetical protein [Oscillospiraceae bacterium]MBQ9906423.1 hypothetical protein [Oscillospiraceae bacterium]